MKNVVYRIRHETEYRYSWPVTLSRQLLRLIPRSTPWQDCLWHEIRVRPEPPEWSWLEDFFGNPVAQFALHTPHDELLVAVESRVAVRSHAPAVAPNETLPWEMAREWLHGGAGGAVLDPAQYLFASPHVPVAGSLAAYARTSFRAGRPLLAAARDLTRRIHRDFQYDPKATTISTPVETVLKQKRGVCQDFAHLQIACLRSLGLAARYVSGYLLTHPAPGKERLVGADASHAWVSVFCPDLGWVDLDPTNDLLVDMEHVTVAWGRDFSDVSPMRGVILGGGEHELDVRVTVEPETEETAA
ncbi:MAG: transglutaminase family protein [Rhodocyclaceae bacterium]|nr:transglutaminase family protein [Rhodocyclaceae bacterium]